DLRRRKQKEWVDARNKADVLRKHWQIDEMRSYPAGALQSRLEDAGRTVPDDDRVWLGRAYLAISTAKFDEAGSWLQKCLARRPDDPSVWRARLEWSVASDQASAAVEAMNHIPLAKVGHDSLLRFRAWLAA